MAVDKAKWHCGGDYPRGLALRNAATHMGLFLDWAISRKLHNPELPKWNPTLFWLLRRRWISGRFYIMWVNDEAFNSDELLNEEGHAFAEACYDTFVIEYGMAFANEHATIYHVPNSSRSARRVAALLDAMFDGWREHVRGGASAI